MIYLATEMLLYLICAALLGISLGWLIWGRSRHRHITKLHTEMTAAIDAERHAADEIRHQLQNADAKLKQALLAEQANSAKALAEVRQLLEAEKGEAREVQGELNQLRAQMDEAANAEKISASNAVQEAMAHAEAQKAAAGEAKAMEMELRAELEELRLMVGAEKLAAETARSERDRIRHDMQSALDTELETSAQTRKALDDIQNTLARTFGAGAGLVAAVDTVSETGSADLTSLDHDQVSDQRPLPLMGDDASETIEPTSSEPTVVEPVATSPINIEPGLAFDVQDEVTPPSTDDRDHQETPETETATSPQEAPVLQEAPILQEVPSRSGDNLEWDGLDEVDSEDQETADLDMSVSHAPLRLGPKAMTADRSDETSDMRPRPHSFYDERPSEVDELQEIGGIDSALEQLLNDHGCYQFRQLAHFSADDIDWLTKALNSVPDLRERIERHHWVDQARTLHLKKYVTANVDRPRWWSRRGL